MIDVRVVQQALADAGDHASAFLWRRVCRDLEEGLRVGVASRERGTGQRLTQRAADQLPRGAAREFPVGGVEWVLLSVGAGEDDPAPSVGDQDRMLGVHAVLWATPVTAALGSFERRAIVALAEAGAPARRAVVLADAHLLARLSDAPAAEAAEVRERVSTLVPASWGLLDEEEVGPWLAEAERDLRALAEGRREAVARFLLDDALARLEAGVVRARADLAQVVDLLGAEDDALEAARRAGARTAAHMLGAIRRNTQQLLVDLREFLLGLEADLRAQVEGVADLDVVRRTLPHWLHHVVEVWMTDRLAQWRADVLAELAEVGIDDEDMARAELLVPALHPAPMRGEPRWGTRIGVTAAAGTGAVLLVLGQWVAGLLALTGGIAWSAIGLGGRDEADRKKLVETAIDAIRQMGGEGERLLSDQLAQLEEGLEDLGTARADAVAGERAEHRRSLEVQRDRRAEALDAAERARERLVAQIQDVGRQAPRP